MLTDKWLSNQIEDIVKPNPKIPVKALKEQLQKKYQVGISIGKVKRARAASMMRAKGDFTRQYSYLRDYVLELEVLKKGLKKGLKTPQLLTAVGIDANHGDDLDLNPMSNFTFISDRQKGIQAAIAQVFPNAKHRFYVRHIYENFKAQWKGVKKYVTYAYAYEQLLSVLLFYGNLCSNGFMVYEFVEYDSVMYDSMVYEFVVYKSVVYEWMMYEFVVYEFVVYEFVVYEFVIYEFVVYEFVVYEFVVYESVKYESVVYDSCVAKLDFTMVYEWVVYK
ncbi:hypothetical protein Tco_1423659 [Tanacetum coccineum]